MNELLSVLNSSNSNNCHLFDQVNGSRIRGWWMMHHVVSYSSTGNNGRAHATGMIPISCIQFRKVTLV
jgi:hypothetical protein